VFNGLGQPIGVYQSNSGAVNMATTPETQYTTATRPAAALTAMTYPNGRVLHYGRDNNALDTAVGRIGYLADDNGSGGVGSHLVDYLYLGQGTMVQQADANGVKLTYLQQSGDSNAITSGNQYVGDPVTGLGRFGQVTDQNWVNTSTPTPTTTDRFQYNYDQNGDVLYSDNLVNASESQLYHSNSATSGDNNTAYDPLARLTSFARGTLSASGNNGTTLDTVTSPSETQSWNLDAVGNQAAVTTNGTTTTNATNAKNELTANGSNDLAFDANGNTVTDQAGNTFKFDPWNHIAVAKNSGGTTIATYAYAANGSRITEAASGTTTGFYYNGPQIIEQRQGGTVTSQNVFNIDYVNGLLLRDDNSTSGNLGISGSGLGRRLFSQHDANFDTTALTNTSGVVQQRFIDSPYGTVTVLSPSWTSTTDSFGWGNLFQGMWRDAVTGLYYTPNRDYSAALARWIEQDPAQYVDGPNSYRTELSNPISGVDAGGLADTQPSTGPSPADPNGAQLFPIPNEKTPLLEAWPDIRSYDLGTESARFTFQLKVRRPPLTPNYIDDWNDAIGGRHRQQQAGHYDLDADTTLYGPNLVAMFTNGIGQANDDLAFVFARDFRYTEAGDEELTAPDEPLITGQWSGINRPDVRNGNTNANDLVNSVISGPLTIYLGYKQHCEPAEQHGTLKTWLMYPNVNANSLNNLLTAINIEWEYSPADRRFVWIAVVGDRAEGPGYDWHANGFDDRTSEEPMPAK
jgi:RHS repeat-associated protein